MFVGRCWTNGNARCYGRYGINATAKNLKISSASNRVEKIKTFQGPRGFRGATGGQGPAGPPVSRIFLLK